MGVAFNAVGPSSSGATVSSNDTLTWNHTCGASATYLLAGVTVDGAPDSDWTITATYNSVSMSSLGVVHADNADNGYLQVFALASPPTGSAYQVKISASGTGTPAGANGGSILFTGPALSAIQSAYNNNGTASLRSAPRSAGTWSPRSPGGSQPPADP